MTGATCAMPVSVLPRGARCAPIAEAMAPAVGGAARRRGTEAGGRTPSTRSASSNRCSRCCRGARCSPCGSVCARSSGCSFPRRFSRMGVEARRAFLADARAVALGNQARPQPAAEAARRPRLCERRPGPRGGRLRGALRRRAVPTAAERPGRQRLPLGDSSRRRSRRAATSSSSARAPAARSPRPCSPRPGHEVLVLEAGPYVDRNSYPRSRSRAMTASTATAAPPSPRAGRRCRRRSAAPSAGPR